MTTEILQIAEIAEAQASKFVTHNEGLRRIEGLLVRVLSRANGGPPGAPSNGDTYIVDSATGDWSAATVNDVAHYYGGTWKFYPPVEGIGLWINDEDLEVHYDGARWIATGSARLVVTNQLSVKSRTANQPASPANGDRYIHNGDVSWSVGSAGDVIARIAGAWYAFTPKKGWWTYVEDEQKRYEYDGGWSEFAGGGGGVSAQFLAGHIDGGELANNATDPDHDIDFAPVVCTMRDGAGNYKSFRSTATITKQIDAPWAEGNNAGGLASALTLSAGSMYIPFFIGKDDGTVDCGWDTDINAANLLADATGYTWFRRPLRGQFTNGSANLRELLQHGDHIYYRFVFVDIEDTSVTSGTIEAAAISVPPGQIAILAVAAQTTSEDTSLAVLHPDQSEAAGEFINSAATAGFLLDNSGSTAADVKGFVSVAVDDLSEVQYVITQGTADRVRILALGWIDDRGRNA